MSSIAVFPHPIGSVCLENGHDYTAGQGNQAGNSGKSRCCSLEPKAVWRQNSFLLWGAQSFLLRLLTDWMRPTNLLQVCWFKCSYLKNTFTVISRLVFNQRARHHRLAMLRDKIHSHRQHSVHPSTQSPVQRICYRQNRAWLWHGGFKVNMKSF